MDDFRSGKFNILIATNIIARGIDIRNVLLVINAYIPRYSFQDDSYIASKSYIHRISRTGRFNDKGIAISLYKPVNPKFQ